MIGVTSRTPVGELVAHGPIDVEGAATLREAAVVMNGEAVGALLIGTTQEAAILTERDLVRALAEGLDPDEARVEDLMTEDVAEIEARETVHDAARIMLADQIRHLVVRGRHDIVGVISIRDVLAALTGGE